MELINGISQNGVEPAEDAAEARRKMDFAAWGDEPIPCPKCGKSEFSGASTENGRYPGQRICLACHIRYDVRSLTILQRSPVPDWKWLAAVSGVVAGGNSVALAERIGVNQMTAWDMIRRIREAVEVSPYIKEEIEGLLLRALLQRAAWRAPGECDWATMSEIDKMVIRDGKRVGVRKKRGTR